MEDQNIVSNVVEILQIIGAGIAFMLAFLAYRLLAQQGNRDNVDQRVLDHIRSFMIFAFSLGVLAIGAQVLNSYIEKVSLPERVNHSAFLSQKIELGNEQETLVIQGGSREAGSCPEGFVITGISNAARVGGKIAGLALFKLDFICTKIELVNIE